MQLKDLKRQLHAERKRAEKLQERLQEVLSESRNKGNVEHKVFVNLPDWVGLETI